MNAAGLSAVLQGISARLKMAFYEDLVKNHKIRQDELDGTRRMAASIVTELQKVPHEKIEALVSHFNGELTKSSERFGASGADVLGSMHQAQIFLGYVSTILAKARIR